MTASQSPNAQAMVSIDGSRVKQLRESQGLTQLYIASVVEVTTDTISRWENKKYPSIKRDNALRLAEALAVSLEDILEKEKEIPTETSETQPEKQHSKYPDHSFKRIWPLLILSGTIGILIVFVSLFFLSQTSSVNNVSATRIIPRYCTPEQPFPIAIEVNGTAGQQKAVILREHLPRQLKILSAFPPLSAPSSQNSHLKWLSRINGPTLFVYIVSLSGNREINAGIEGSISVNGQSEDVKKTQGPTTIEPSTFHWADSDGDHVISDKEILTVYDLFGGIDLLKDDVDFVEEMWLGTGYRWNQVKSSYDIIP